MQLGKDGHASQRFRSREIKHSKNTCIYIVDLSLTIVDDDLMRDTAGKRKNTSNVYSSARIFDIHLWVNNLN